MKLNSKYLVFWFSLFIFHHGESFCKEISFEQANTFYMSQQYDSAISAYENIIGNGNNSAEIFYNLGNAYYKTGAYTKAILNFERAKKLKPVNLLKVVHRELTYKNIIPINKPIQFDYSLINTQSCQTIKNIKEKKTASG